MIFDELEHDARQADLIIIYESFIYICRYINHGLPMKSSTGQVCANGKCAVDIMIRLHLSMS